VKLSEFQLDEFTNPRGEYVHVFLDGDRAVGRVIIVVEEDYEDTAFVQSLVTFEDYRGQHLGTQLLHWVLERYKDYDIELHPEPFSAGANCPPGLGWRQLVSWYRRHGFQPAEAGNLIRHSPTRYDRA
jgi:GNAT superfamily N-acetyltransferase